jgi:hypothetical protein
MIQLTATMIRTLKGCPISVVIALMVNRAPATAQWLERTTGYSDKVVLSALQFLQENQFITRNGRYTWQLADGVEQLPLGAALLEEPKQTGTRNFSESEILRLGEIPGPLARSRSSILDPKLEKNLDLDSSDDPEKFRVEENLAECDRQKIREPAKTRISNLPHVSAEYIRYICKTSNGNGLAITRMDRGDRGPGYIAPKKPIPVPVDDQPEETSDPVPVDDQAASWWIDMTEKLRELLPSKAVFLSWVQRDAPARRIGDALVVLASNEMTGKTIIEHLSQAVLNDLVQAISGGAVNRIYFVTHFEGG